MGQFINLEYFFYKIYQLLAWIVNLLFGGSVFGEGAAQGSFWERLPGYAPTVRLTFELLTVFFITGIIYCIVRVWEIRREEISKMEKVKQVVVPDIPERNSQWSVVIEHMNSDNPSDWRLAIIEADNMLDDLIKKLGYEGEDLGERLKSADPSRFRSIESAWEAHKIRNQIVHQGVGFEITPRETERVVSLYERVFREFGYI